MEEEEAKLDIEPARDTRREAEGAVGAEKGCGARGNGCGGGGGCWFLAAAAAAAAAAALAAAAAVAAAAAAEPPPSHRSTALICRRASTTVLWSPAGGCAGVVRARA